MSATCKNHIRRYINEGHDVTTAEQMNKAIFFRGGVEGVRVVVVDVATQETPEKRKITGTSKLNTLSTEIKVCWPDERMESVQVL